MNKLDVCVIRSLFDKFAILTCDAQKKEILDQLGLHPVNHAWFATFVAVYGHPCDWQTYLALTAWIK